MTKTVQYYGTPNYYEEPLTGHKRLWTTGMVQEIGDRPAGLMLAIGNNFHFYKLGVGPVIGIGGILEVGKTISLVLPQGMTATGATWTRDVGAGPVTIAGETGTTRVLSSADFAPIGAVNPYYLGVAPVGLTFSSDRTSSGTTAAVIAPIVPPVATGTVGQVATASFIPDNKHATAVSFNSRSPHTARDAIAGSLQIAFANWFVDRTTVPYPEALPGGVTTFSASIEYPAGVFTQVKWGGTTTIATIDGGQDLSDPIAVNIPNGALFWVVVHGEAAGTAKMLWSFSNYDSANGAALEWSATSVTDKTMGGTIVDSGLGGVIAPVLIVAPTNSVSWALFGDSRTNGGVEAYANGTTDRGEITRSIGATFPYINAATAGDRLYAFNASWARRVFLANWCSHVFIGYPYNDITESVAAATCVSRMTTAAAKFSGKPVYCETLSPSTTGTWVGAAGAGQTLQTFSSIINTYNGSVRSGISGFTGYFDIADQTMTARDSGFWKANYTADGVHATAAGSLLIQTALQTTVTATPVSYAWGGGITLNDADFNAYLKLVFATANTSATAGTLTAKASTAALTFIKSAKTKGYWSTLTRLNLAIGNALPIAQAEIVSTVGFAGSESISGGVTFAESTGFVIGTGSTDFMNSGYVPAEATGGAHAYLRTTQGSGGLRSLMGCRDSGSTSIYRLAQGLDGSGGGADPLAVTGTWGGPLDGTHISPSVGGGLVAGFWGMSRIGASELSLYKNGATVSKGTAATSPASNTFRLYTGANNGAGTATQGIQTGSLIAGMVTHTGLTDAMAANLYADMQTFQTTMGRNV